jgi:hypothetical protein
MLHVGRPNVFPPFLTIIDRINTVQEQCTNILKSLGIPITVPKNETLVSNDKVTWSISATVDMTHENPEVSNQCLLVDPFTSKHSPTTVVFTPVSARMGLTDEQLVVQFSTR